jgi:site-specific recombinase XerD
LKKDHIEKGIDCEKMDFQKTPKTDIKSKNSSITNCTRNHSKYASHPRCLNEDSILPNQNTNSYLKEIGDLCYIPKEITFHMARHTFATSVTLTNGVPIETVSKMQGHKNI